MKPLTAQTFLQSRIHRLLRKSHDDYSKTIGAILRKRGIITEEQLQNALKVQKDKLYTLGKAVRLGQIIVELGYALEEELVKAVNDEYQISINTLTDDIKGLVKKNAKALLMLFLHHVFPSGYSFFPQLCLLLSPPFL
jgi:transcription initiation factor IIE alpha subunit